MKTYRDRMKDRQEVYGLRDNILSTMDALLFKCLDQKLMVLLWTDMVPENAVLLVPICEQLRIELVNEFAKTPSCRFGTLSLLNAAILLLNRWRHMFRRPNNVATFYAQSDTLFVQLEQLRTDLLTASTVDANAFYGNFLESFKTMPLK